MFGFKFCWQNADGSLGGEEMCVEAQLTYDML